MEREESADDDDDDDAAVVGSDRSSSWLSVLSSVCFSSANCSSSLSF